MAFYLKINNVMIIMKNWCNFSQNRHFFLSISSGNVFGSWDRCYDFKNIFAEKKLRF
jgi:hypothetical protein